MEAKSLGVKQDFEDVADQLIREPFKLVGGFGNRGGNLGDGC